MKVLLVTDTLHAGGAETFVLRLARTLNRMGVPAEILSLNPDLEDKGLIAQFPELTIHRVSLPLLRWLKRVDRLLKMLGLSTSIQYALTKRDIERRGLLNYDVYHTHLMPVDLLMARIKKQHPGLRIVSTLHGDYNGYEEHWHNKGRYRQLGWPGKVRLVKEEVDGWVYISEHQVELLEQTYGFDPAKMHKIYNGYEPPTPVVAPAPSQKEGLRFIMVARGIPEKGWQFLFKAFQQLEGPHELLAVGKGPTLDELKGQYGQDERIRFIPFHPNPAQLIAESDVFVFTSVYTAESLPTVVIEALYCGKPVISSNIGEVAEMLRIEGSDEKAGVLVEWRDPERYVDELRRAMQAFVADPALIDRYHELAPWAFAKFDMEHCARQYITLYEEVCSS